MKLNKIFILVIITLALFSCSAGVSLYKGNSNDKYNMYYPYRGTQIYDDYIYRAQMRGYLPTPYCAPARNIYYRNNYKRY